MLSLIKGKIELFWEAGPSGVIASYVYDRFIIKNITPTGKIRLDNDIYLVIMGRINRKVII